MTAGTERMRDMELTVPMMIILVYLLLVNVIGFVLMFVDEEFLAYVKEGMTVTVKENGVVVVD